ncbi:MAG: orotidine-5'-phosphate decarboxylase, partial [Pseudomonadota bacterium]|nr:orotidine-5'-phosphate decarboxylase [Pseudomonadota bacterium]
MTAAGGHDHFADRLVLRARRLGHPLCAGLDPFLDRIPDLFRDGTMAPGDPRTAPAVARFLTAFLDRVAGRVVVVKPQIAMFERLGWPGIKALHEVIDHARARDLPVLLDAKRGDIGSTSTAYANAWIGHDAAFPSDALTVNPWLGIDTLA